MRADPIDKALRIGGFRVCVVGCSEDVNKQLTCANLAGRPINQLQLRAGVVYEHSLAGDMHLPHRWR